MVPTTEVDVPLAEQWHQYLKRLLETAAEVVVWVAKCFMLRRIGAGTEAQDQATATRFVEGHRHLGEQRWIPEAVASHE
jgi:hypothetical protein